MRAKEIRNYEGKRNFCKVKVERKDEGREEGGNKNERGRKRGEGEGVGLLH